MNRIVAEHPKRQIHVILDNLNTHKPKNDRWLKRHLNVHFPFTPTRASWLNQIEIWFSILADQSLAGVSFNSVVQLRSHIDAFIEDYNEYAKPFAWTKSEVHQKRLILKLADPDSWAPPSARDEGADIPLYLRTFLPMDVSEGRTQHESTSPQAGIKARFADQ